jgi:hypothetical protein
MTIKVSDFGGRCPYELVSGGMAGCVRFEPRVVFDRPTGPITTCAHVRCSIGQGPGRSEATFYARCVLRSGDLEAERAFVVPLD